MATWLLTLTDGTEYELTDQEYKFMQDKIDEGKKMVFYREKAINTNYIRHVRKLQEALPSGEFYIQQPPQKTEEQLKAEYELYLWNLKDFEKQMRAGTIEGFGTQRARDKYLSRYFNPEPHSYEDFVKRYRKDFAKGEEHLDMQRWFWR